jgi:hypothetical protein
VFVGGSFDMSGGEISGNTASYYGGGVCVNGSFTMDGGEISGNNTIYGGGGVFVNSSGSFGKTLNGTIYGSDEAETSLKNTAGSSTWGPAVYYAANGANYYRSTTLIAGENISTDTLPGSGTGYGWTKQ